MITLKSPILLVGEASFAFAAAFSEKIDEWNKTRVLASCYQSELDVYRLHVQSHQNVCSILTRTPSHSVLFGVDATRLETYEEIVDYNPRTVFFNLPHVGGKSDIKKNRLLMKEFFISCSKLPFFGHDGESGADQKENYGEVWITLLNGQGGTGMDSPRRDWANSWQITSMAAEGGFILTSCFPYADSSLPSYDRTGFRGRDQSFQKQSRSIVHVFQRGPPPLTVPKRIETMKEMRCHSGLDQLTNDSYLLPSHIADRMEHFRQWPDTHPTRTLLSQLLIIVDTEVEEHLVDKDAYIPPVITQSEVTTKVHETEKFNSSGSEYFLHALDKRSTISNLSHLKTSLTCGVEERRGSGGGAEGEEKVKHFLRSCIMQSALERFKEDKRSIVAHGDCYYQPTLPDLNTFSYELCLITEKTDLFDFHLNRLAGVIAVPVQIFPDELDNGGKSLFPSDLPLNKFPARWSKGIIELEKYYTDEDQSRIIGFKGGFAGQAGLKVVLLDVSLLAARTHESKLSLFPPIWSHCFSFWECPDFDERLFVDLALTFGGHILLSIELVEIYEGADGHISRCYRLIHQSFSSPLTKSMSNSIQLALRTFLQEEMKIEPR